MVILPLSELFHLTKLSESLKPLEAYEVGPCLTCYRWSLLEKYSCKASKLHLKPRRFKIFIEALVSQHHLFPSLNAFLYMDQMSLLYTCAGLTDAYLSIKEHQLLKDRKKSVRKRPSQGENCPPATSTFSNQSRSSGHDNRPFKLFLVDSQNIQKVGHGRASLKRNVNIGINRSNKGDSTTMKPARQRRKSGVSFYYYIVLFICVIFYF